MESVHHHNHHSRYDSVLFPVSTETKHMETAYPEYRKLRV